jgi:putative salt-induced outer membrane protein YdiY
MAECGAGLEHTDFRDDTSSENEIILVPRAYLKKKLLGESVLVQDTVFYPSLEEVEDYRFHSETTLKNPFTDKLSLNLSLINDYNSNPTEDIKKHDLSVITSLEYSF